MRSSSLDKDKVGHKLYMSLPRIIFQTGGSKAGRRRGPVAITPASWGRRRRVCVTATPFGFAVPAQVKGQQGIASLVQKGRQVRVSPAVLSQAMHQAYHPFGFGVRLPALGVKLQPVFRLPSKFKVLHVASKV